MRIGSLLLLAVCCAACDSVTGPTVVIETHAPLASVEEVVEIVPVCTQFIGADRVACETAPRWWRGRPRR